MLFQQGEFDDLDDKVSCIVFRLILLAFFDRENSGRFISSNITPVLFDVINEAVAVFVYLFRY